MSELVVRRAHALGLARARAAAQKVADDLARNYDLRSSWEGDTLRFSRSGIDGALRVTDDQVEVVARLGLLAAAFRPRIEEQIQRNFERYFAA